VRASGAADDLSPVENCGDAAEIPFKSQVRDLAERGEKRLLKQTLLSPLKESN